ncbi:MAG: hypothetical protein AAFY80_07020 [Pseudomonadota bacterium]
MDDTGLQDFVTALTSVTEPWRILDSYLGKDGTPADWQKEMSREATKDGAQVFALCSRRAGKSIMSSALAAAELALPKRKVIVVAPTLAQSKLLRLSIEELLRDHVPLPLEYEATQEELRIANGSNLRCIAAGQEGSGVRGEGIRDGALIIDEAAYCDARVFDAALPLVEERGKLLLLTTPAAKDPANRAYQMWTDTKTYNTLHRIRVNAYDQPYLQAKLGRAMKLMPKEMLEREYGTQWLAKDGVALVPSEALAAANSDRKGWTFDLSH